MFWVIAKSSPGYGVTPILYRLRVNPENYGIVTIASGHESGMYKNQVHAVTQGKQYILYI